MSELPLRLPTAPLQIDLVQAGYLMAILHTSLQKDPENFLARSLFNAVKEAASRLLKEGR